MLRPADPLDCARAEALLEALLDGELRQDQATPLRLHLAGCPGCRAELDLARSVQDALRDLPEIDLPPCVRNKTGRVGEGNPAKRWWPGLAAAAAIIVAILLPALSSQLRHQPPAAHSQELERAIADSRLAVALVMSVSRRAGHELREETLGHHLVQPAVHRMLRPLWRNPVQQSPDPPHDAASGTLPTRS